MHFLSLCFHLVLCFRLVLSSWYHYIVQNMATEYVCRWHTINECFAVLVFVCSTLDFSFLFNASMLKFSLTVLRSDQLGAILMWVLCYTFITNIHVFSMLFKRSSDSFVQSKYYDVPNEEKKKEYLYIYILKWRRK